MKGKGKISPKKSAKSAGARNERKRTEEALRDSDSRTRSIVESLPIGMHLYRLEADGRLVFTGANAAADNILGVDNAVFIGKTIEEAFPALKETEVPQRYREVAATGKAWQTESIEYKDNDITGAFEVHAFQTAPNTMVAVFEDITARKQSELALQLSEAKYRRLYDETPVLLHSIDRNGIVVEVNNYWLKTLGYERDEVIGRKVTDFFTDASRKYAQEVVQPAFFRDGIVKDIAYQFVKKNGEVVDVLLSAMGERDAAGNVVRSLAVIQDITDRKRAGEALQASESRYRAIVDSQTEFVVRYLPGGILTFVNDTLCRYIGMRREDLLGKSYYPFMHPDDREEFIQKIEALDRDNPVMVAEARVVLPDGRVTWHQWTHHAIFEERGEAVEYQSTGRDVTELKKAAERLRESEEKFSKIYRKAPLLITLSDIETGRFLDVNDRFLEISGFTREEVVGRTAIEIGWISGEQRGRMQQILRERGRVSGMELSLRRRDGGEVVCLYNGEIITVGGTQRLLSIAQDISERKKAESDLELFKNLINRSSEAIFVNDPQTGRFVDMNDRACSSLGYSRDELLKMGVRDIEGIFPDARAWQEHVADVRRRGSLLLEGMHKKKDGTAFPVEIGVDYVELGAAEYMIAVVRDVSERKQADEALRERERQLAESQRIAHVGSWQHNVKTSRVVWSDELFRLLGLDPRKDPADFTTFFEMLHPEDQPILKNAIDTTLREKKPFSIEYRFVLRDGTTRTILAQAELIPDDAGELVILSGTAQDITDRKRAEEENDRLARAVSIVTEGIAVTDEQDRFIYLNDAHAKTYGYVQSELMGKTWRDLTPREFVPLIEPELARTLHSRESGIWSGESPGLCKDGTRIATEITATARWNEKGEYAGHICVVRDVTERKRVEEELREKESKYRILFEAANDGIFIQDNTGFRDCNQRGAEMYGLTKEEVIGRSPEEFAPERQPDGRLSAEVAAEKIQAALNGVPQVFEWKPLRADGKPFDVEITLSRLELGGKMCLQAIVRDISERKRLEQEHLKSEKLQSIGTLAGGIAHDFNNLLQGVFGYISMAKLTYDQKEKSLSMLEQAEKALHQSVSLTSQLLTFSKGGKPLKKVIDLKPLIENAVKFALSGSRVDYALSIDDDLRPVEADEGQLGQVVQNIVLNAEQAMPLGGRIEIAARNVLASSLAGVPEASSGDLVEITVRDQGIGIPPEHLPKIFDPYFTTKEKGSGLGLATTYSIIKNHDGDINVSSVLGKGTTFAAYFPAAGQKAEGAASPADPRTVRKGRVLVMDDEELVRKVAYELLTGLDHEAELAVHGGEAVEKYRQAKAAGRPFDVVILDLTIRGGMGGEETMRKLLEIDPGVKAIVSSGYSNDSVVANYRDHGFAAFLKKPYDLTDLQATLNALLG